MTTETKERSLDAAMASKELCADSSSKASSSTSSVNLQTPKRNPSVVATASRDILHRIGNALLFFWHWSVPYRSANREIDPTYAAIWGISLDEENIRNVLHTALPDIPVTELPSEEEQIRAIIRAYLPPPFVAMKEKAPGEINEETAEQLETARLKAVTESPEETWEHIPVDLRHLLAAYNAQNLEKKLDMLYNEPYHPKAGSGSVRRSSNGVRKTFRMWRLGFSKAVSPFERVAVDIFIAFLAFSACYPDVAAGFLGERSYNQRSIGSRIATLCQLFSLTIFPYHSFWLLFNWSLERLIGALVGNTIYALAAVVPAIHRAYGTQWFRFTLLGLSMTWQVGVQFTPTLRDYVVRLMTRRQMRQLRDRGETEAIHWTDVDAAISHELTTNKGYIQLQSKLPSHEVPFRTRTERFIKFTATYNLGRPADQLVSLLKDDLEVVVNTYQDYARSSPTADKEKDKGHVEPPMPKIALVIFDAAIFAYICYSFWTQPFTFNTTVAYGTVVVLKQAVLAAKRYQTAKNARRLFTNMVAFNILGIFLVSTPVTINRDVLKPTLNFVLLTLAMVFATLFLSEPIAPLVLKAVEKMVALSSKMGRKSKKKGAEQQTEKTGL